MSLHHRAVDDRCRLPTRLALLLEVGDRDDQERVRTAFGDETYQRLRTIKARYDPDNVFRSNHNISPPDLHLA